ncbi:MAG: hypothetical protein JXM68_04720, partial [Sedimentisphaerales bacterium]|nr:hypothetical protein [Sedimentisphaerales bacterium]
MSKNGRLVLLLAVLVGCFALTTVSFAAKGSFAPEGTIGSQDNGGPGFVYRAPVNKTANITGPVPSNDWWSGLLVRDNTITVSPYPLILAPCQSLYPAEGDGFGMAIGYKGTGYVQNSGGGPVVGYSKGAWKISSYVMYDLLVRNGSMDQATTKTKLDSHGDWHIKMATMDASGRGFYTTAAAGSAFASMTFVNGQPKINLSSFGADVLFYTKDGTAIMTSTTGSYTGDHIIFRVKHPVTQEIHWFGLFSAPGTVWTRTEATKLSITIGGGANYLNAAVLPSQSDASTVYNHAYNVITGTRANYTYTESTADITTTFNFTTTRQRVDSGLSAEALTYLMPHQYKHLAAGYSPMSSSIPTMRGPLKLFSGNTFKTVLKNSGILYTFNEPTGSASYSHANMLQYLRDEQYVKDYYNVDTYGGGKAMLRIAESIVIADKLGDPTITDYDPAKPAFKAKEAFVTSLYNEFANWFTYSPGAEPTFWADGGAHHFMTYFSPAGGYYGQLTGWRAGFGAQALNDQHFHYGYWIHAAAILASYHPTFVADYGWAIDEIIRNIGTPDRNDPKYPYLRYFSPYMGRSYASGWYWDDNYNGNDQESTSEAMNAWAGIYLWGLVTGDTTYRDAGLYMYWTEKSAIDQYWLDVDNENLSPLYPYSMAVILRDTAYEYNTFWGSQQIEELYGIQMLPISAPMLYLGLNQTYANKYWNEMKTINQGISGTDFDAWDGIMLRYLALINPLDAISKFQFGKVYGPDGATWTPIQDHETWHSTYWFIHNMNQLGAPSTDYYADKPSYGVFKKGSTYNFVAYNPLTTPMTINFKNSSGQTVFTINDVPPQQTVYAMNGSVPSFSSISSVSSSSVSSVSSSSVASSVISSSISSVVSSSAVSSVVSSSAVSSVIPAHPYTVEFLSGGAAKFT